MSGAANRWPEVDIVADSLQSKDRTLGKLELLAQPSGADWQIRKLTLVNDVGRIDAEGSWRNAGEPLADTARRRGRREGGGRHSSVASAGPTPSRAHRRRSTDSFRGTARRAISTIRRSRAISSFARARDNSRRWIRASGRLLGVLSLQALPRRISLDFRDVFSEGFAFDTIAADVQHAERRHAYRRLPPRSVRRQPSTSPATSTSRSETQQLKVRVQPSLSSGVSAGAAALFIANPLIGAAVGAGDAARAEDAEQSVRPALQLRIRGDGQLG